MTILIKYLPSVASLKLPGFLAWPSLRHAWRAWIVFSLVVLIWTALSWVVVERYEQDGIDSYLRRERANAEQNLRLLTVGVGQSLNMAEGFLANLARQDSIISALQRANSHQGDPGQLFSDPALLALSRGLYAMVGDLKMIGVLMLMDRKGDVIGASNVMTFTSAIGTSGGDRSYFASAMAGQRGTAFVVGRTTNLPGLYLSLPVLHEGTIGGALVAKLDGSTLAPWISNGDFFLADENGVIMVARDNGLLFKTLPGTKIGQLSMSERVQTYKRSTFNALPLTRDLLPDHPEIAKLEDRAVPVMLVTSPLLSSDASAGVLYPLPRLTLLLSERFETFVTVAVAGFLLEFLLFMMVMRQRALSEARRRAEQEVQFLQTAYDAASMAIAVFSEDGFCVGTNEAMARLCNSNKTMMRGLDYRSHDLWLESGLVGAFDQVLIHGTPQRGNWRLNPGFGQEIWIEASLKRFSYRSKHYLLAMFADVTEQHWREQFQPQI